jgi:sarcosine oxidase
MRADVIVVGLGAVGSATLYQLARRGVKALGVDRFAPPHEYGSSHGETRITRQGIGEGDDYVPLALRAHQIWRELEAETGDDLLLACGLAIIGSRDGAGEVHGKSDFLRRSQAAAARHGIPHEVLSRADASKRFEQFVLKDDEIVYFEPGGGIVFPERCIASQLSLARRLGAQVRFDQSVVSVHSDRGAVRVVTEEGALEADQVVLAAGAWNPQLSGGLLSRLTLQPQTLHWFEADEPHLYASERCPAFIWMHGSRAESFYGFPISPSVPTRAVKVATERTGTIAAPEDYDREAAPKWAAPLFAEHINGRLRGLRPQPLRSAACLYTMAPDAEFVIGRAPGSERVIVASACSGHGFKHSAAIGEMLSEFVLSPGTQPPAAFRISRL